MNRRALTETKNTTRGSNNGESSFDVYLMSISQTWLLVSENIVLGPPKTAFSSAAGGRHANKSYDSSHRSNPGDDDALNGDRYNFRERFGKDGQKTEKDGEKARDTRPTHAHNRKDTKEDSETWSSARHHKGIGHDDSEQAHRRNGDRYQEKDKDGTRDSKTQRGFENHRRDGDREGTGAGENTTRRNGIGKGLYEPSWYREDDRQAGTLIEGEKDASKPREWRNKDQGGARRGDRDWNKTSKSEQDPEWMDEPEPEGKTQAHTQEDFERWKERMRAGHGPAQDPPQLPAEPRPTHERTTSSMSINMSKGKAETPLVVDSNFDGFFGLWSDKNKDGWQPGNDEKTENSNVVRSKAPKSSKFTGFFNNISTVDSGQPKVLEPLSPGTAKDSSNEDKEGFKRILKLLDQQQTNSTRNESQHQEHITHNGQQSPPINSSRSLELNGLESLLKTQVVHKGPVLPNRDSEFLLKLMQQTPHTQFNANQANSTEKRPAGAQAPGLLSISNLTNPPRDLAGSVPGNAPPGFLNEPVKEDSQHRDKLNPNASAAERRGLPPGFPDGASANNVMRNSAAATAIYQSTLAARLQRPPGLEQVLPTYGQNTILPRQNPVPPPPGFQATLHNTHNPFPPGLIPNLSNPKIQNDRTVPLPYGMRPMNQLGSAGMPPPGFMPINPSQPPGFSPFPFNQDGRMSPPGRMLYGAGPAPQRQVTDGFGDGAGFGMSAPGLLPAQQYRPAHYRRPE